MMTTLDTATTRDIALAAATLGEQNAGRIDELEIKVVAHIERASANLASHQTRIEALERRKGFLYQFKIVPELGWSVLVAVGTVLAQGATDAESVSNWKAWAIGLTAGLVRAVIGAVLAYRAGTVTKQ